MLTSDCQPVLNDASGICFPAPAGCAVDRLSSICTTRAYEKILVNLQTLSLTANPTVVNFMEQMIDLLNDLPPWTVIQAFKPAVTNYYLDENYWQDDPAPTTLGVIRFLIGVPGNKFTVIIPSEAFPEEGLYLPHLHVRLHNNAGPVAVCQEDHAINFTWVDGMTMTLPYSSGCLQPDDDAPRLTIGTWAQDWVVLNGMMDISSIPLPMLTPPLSHISVEDIETLLAGRELLQEVWPLAYGSVQRCYNSVLMQPYDDQGTSSISMNVLHGALISSARDPIQVGDALCHEGSHARMNLAFTLDPLLENSSDETHPSPWRQDLRPLSGLLNGIHAFLNVCKYYQKVMDVTNDIDSTADMYKLQRERVLQAWEYMAPRIKPTSYGAMILNDMEAGIGELQ